MEIQNKQKSYKMYIPVDLKILPLRNYHKEITNNMHKMFTAEYIQLQQLCDRSVDTPLKII